MKKMIVGLALAVQACTPAAQQQAQPQPAAGTTTGTAHTTAGATTTGGATGTGAGGTTGTGAGGTSATGAGGTSATGAGGTTATPTGGGGGALDVVVFLALDSATKDVGDRARAGAAAMLAAAEKNGADTHLAVVAGKKDRGDAVLSAVAKAIDFDLAPKDAMIAAVVAGCGAGDSDFPDPHLAGSNPKVCGTELLTLAGNTADAITHSWLWALNPVKGALTGFFRPGAKRLYAFVANGDAQLFDAAAFNQLAGAQGGGAISTVVAVPLTACGLDEAAATRYPALGGGKVDLCAATAAQMGSAMALALKAAAP